MVLKVDPKKIVSLLGKIGLNIFRRYKVIDDPDVRIEYIAYPKNQISLQSLQALLREYCLTNFCPNTPNKKGLEILERNFSISSVAGIKFMNLFFTNKQGGWYEYYIHVYIYTKKVGRVFTLPYLREEIKKGNFIKLNKIDPTDILRNKNRRDSFTIIKGRFKYRKKQYIVIPSKKHRWQIVQVPILVDHYRQVQFRTRESYLLVGNTIERDPKHGYAAIWY